MAEQSKIEWCDATFNPWIGCTKISPACDHCYAEAWDRRFAVSGHAMRWGTKAPRTRTSAANWRQPVRWNAQADDFEAAHGRRRRVFCASLADVFDNAVPPVWREDLFKLIADTPRLDWLLLTKRIGNASDMMFAARGGHLPLLPNLWIGATVCTQDEADRDVPKLLETPAAVRFLSIEPMLGAIDLTCDGLVCTPCPWCSDHSADPDTGVVEQCWRCEWTGKSDEWAVDWVICGGESGPNARPMNPGWVRSLRDQCEAASVPFLFKQWGEWREPHEGESFDTSTGMAQRIPAFIVDNNGGVRCFVNADTLNGSAAMLRVGKRAAGRLLDGIEHNGFPR